MELSHELMSLGLQERNVEIQTLHGELSQVEEIMQSLAFLVQEQGASLSEIENSMEEAVVNVEEGTLSLGKASILTSELRGKIVDGITLGVTTLGGAAGFFAGPIVGTCTLAGGITLGASLIALRRK